MRCRCAPGHMVAKCSFRRKGGRRSPHRPKHARCQLLETRARSRCEAHLPSCGFAMLHAQLRQSSQPLTAACCLVSFSTRSPMDSSARDTAWSCMMSGSRAPRSGLDGADAADMQTRMSALLHCQAQFAAVAAIVDAIILCFFDRCIMVSVAHPRRSPQAFSCVSSLLWHAKASLSRWMDGVVCCPLPLTDSNTNTTQVRQHAQTHNHIVQHTS